MSKPKTTNEIHNASRDLVVSSLVQHLKNNGEISENMTPRSMAAICFGDGGTKNDINPHLYALSKEHHEDLIVEHLQQEPPLWKIQLRKNFYKNQVPIEEMMSKASLTETNDNNNHFPYPPLPQNYYHPPPQYPPLQPLEYFQRPPLPQPQYLGGYPGYYPPPPPQGHWRPPAPHPNNMPPPSFTPPQYYNNPRPVMMRPPFPGDSGDEQQQDLSAEAEKIRDVMLLVVATQYSQSIYGNRDPDHDILKALPKTLAMKFPKLAPWKCEIRRDKILPARGQYMIRFDTKFNVLAYPYRTD